MAGGPSGGIQFVPVVVVFIGLSERPLSNLLLVPPVFCYSCWQCIFSELKGNYKLTQTYHSDIENLINMKLGCAFTIFP
ncbi:hypothetical protein DFH07DRAFT_835814, partial [Mycena maculata]